MPVFSAKPQQLQATAPIDLIGELINLHRLPGEDLKSFKTRVLDVYIHPANSTYTGLYNGISRELGISNYSQGLIIDVKRNPGNMGAPLDEQAYVKMNSKRIEFYSSNTNGTVFIDTHSRDGGGYYIHELISTLDAVVNSPFEIATWGAGAAGIDWAKVSYLLRYNSSKLITKTPLRQGRLHTFYNEIEHGNWITHINFPPSSGITQRVYQLEDLVSGTYYLDNIARVVHTHDYVDGHVSIKYQKFPMVLPLGEVNIHSFADTTFMDTISHQQELTHSTSAIDALEGLPTVNELPSVEGAAYINELLSVVPMYWGE